MTPEAARTTRPDSGQATSGRGWRWLRVAILVALVAATVAAFIALPTRNRLAETALAQVNLELDRIGGLRVASDSSRIDLLGSPGSVRLVLSGVRVETAMGEVLMRAGSLSAQAGIRSLLRGERAIESAVLDRPEIRLRRGPEEGFLLVAEDGEASVSLSVLAALGGGVATASRPDVRVDNGTIWWFGEGAETDRWRLASVRISVPGGEGPAFAEGSASLGWEGEPASGQFSFTANWFQGVGGKLALTLHAVHAGKLASLLGSAPVGLDPINAVSGEVEVEFQPDGSLEGASGVLSMVFVGGDDEAGTPFGIRQANLDFAYHPVPASISIHRIDLVTDLLTATGAASLRLGTGGELISVIGLVESAQGRVPINPERTIDLFSASGAFAFHSDDGQLQLSDAVVMADSIGFEGGASVRFRPLAGGEGNRIEGEFALDRLGLSDAITEIGPIEVGEITGGFSYERDNGTLQLTLAARKWAGVSLQTSLEVILPEGDASRASLVLGLPDLDLEKLFVAWPHDLYPASRNWFGDNVKTTRIGGTVRLDGLGGRVRPEIEFFFSETDFTYFGDMPAIRDSTGKGLVNEKGTTILVNSGYLETNGRRVEITEGSYRTPGVEWVGKRKVALRASGLAIDLLDIAALTPLVDQDDGESATALLGGDGILDVELELPLDKRDPDWGKPVPYRISGSLNDVAIDSGDVGVTLRGVAGSFEVEPGRLRFDGAASIDNPSQVANTVAPADGDSRSAVERSLSPRPAPAASEAGGTVGPVDLATVLGGGTLPILLTAEADAERNWHFQIAVDSAHADTGPQFPFDPPVLVMARGHLRGAEMGDITLDRLVVRREGFDLVASGSIASGPVIGLNVEGTVAPELLSAPGLEVQGEQPVFIRMQVESGEGGSLLLKGRVDFLEAAVAAPDVGIGKEAGEPGTVGFEGRIENGMFRLSDITVELGAVWAHGTIGFAADGTLESANLDEVRIGSRSQFSVDFHRELDGTRHIVLQGNSLDLCELAELSNSDRPPDRVDPSKADGGVFQSCSDLGEQSEFPFLVTLRIRRLHVAPALWLEDAEGDIELSPGSPPSGSITGHSFGGIESRLVLGGEGSDSSETTFEAENAGEVLRALGITDNVLGGRLVARLHSDPETEDEPESIDVRISDVIVRDTPLVKTFLSFVSAFGLIEYLLGGEEEVELIELDLEQENGQYRFRDGMATTPTIGFLFAGTYEPDSRVLDVRGFATPLRRIRSVLGQIPLIGLAFEDSEGRATLGAGFRVSGTADDPDFEVQPLTALIPFLPQVQDLAPPE